MTTTMEEVAGWLRELSGWFGEMSRLSKMDCTIDLNMSRSKMWADRAVQVEAMDALKTCDTCRWWENRLLVFQKSSCNYRARTDRHGDVGFCGPKFGCIHYEDKQQINSK